MTTTNYQKKILACRTLRDKVQSVASKKILSVLQTAADDLTRIMLSTDSDTFTYANYAAKKESILKLITSMTSGLNLASQYSMQSIADGAVDIYSESAYDYANSKGFNYNIGASFSTVSAAAVSNVTGRLWLDGMNFSDRVWVLNTYAQNSINDILTAGIARGQSAVDLSKSLQEFLLNPTLTSGTTWTTAIKPSVSGRGTINYNALRLARTEINNTYRETLILSNEANPITLCVHWNLSVSHKIRDICDVFAYTDQYGYGAGNFPPSETPIDHPNGKCYLTEVLRDKSLWNTPKQFNYNRKNISSETIKETLGTDAKQYEVNAAIKAYSNNNKLIDKNTNTYRKAM